MSESATDCTLWVFEAEYQGVTYTSELLAPTEDEAWKVQRRRSRQVFPDLDVDAWRLIDEDSTGNRE